MGLIGAPGRLGLVPRPTLADRTGPGERCGVTLRDLSGVDDLTDAFDPVELFLVDFASIFGDDLEESALLIAGDFESVFDAIRFGSDVALIFPDNLGSLVDDGVVSPLDDNRGSLLDVAGFGTDFADGLLPLCSSFGDDFDAVGSGFDDEDFGTLFALAPPTGSGDDDTCVSLFERAGDEIGFVSEIFERVDEVTGIFRSGTGDRLLLFAGDLTLATAVAGERAGRDDEGDRLLLFTPRSTDGLCCRRCDGGVTAERGSGLGDFTTLVFVPGDDLRVGDLGVTGTAIRGEDFGTVRFDGASAGVWSESVDIESFAFDSLFDDSNISGSDVDRVICSGS